MTNILDRLWLALIIFLMSAGIYAVILSALGRISYNYPSKEKYPDYNEGFKWGFKAGQLLPDNLCSQIGQTDCYYYVPPYSKDVSGQEPTFYPKIVYDPINGIRGYIPEIEGTTTLTSLATISCRVMKYRVNGRFVCVPTSGYEGNRK